MKELAKRTTVAALAGVMAVGMLTGCGEKKLDGTATVATVDGTAIPMGVVSLAARYQQAQTEAMYKSFMGSYVTSIWDMEADEETGETYGQQAVNDVLEQVELMCILKEKAADYGVEVTEEDQEAIAEAAAAFMEANSEETIEAIAATQDDVKTYLELETYRERIYDKITAEANVEISDEEAQQSGFSYVNVSISDEELTDEDKEQKKEQAQEILDAMKEDPEADMDEVAKGVDETFSGLTGTFTTNVSEDDAEDEDDYDTSAYPDEVMEVLRGLKDGEVAPELVETESGYYIVRMDNVFDEDATESERESLKSAAESDYYTETTEKWLDEADIKVEEKVLKTLVISDSHTFTIQTAADEEIDDAEVLDEDAELEDIDEDAVIEDLDEDADAEAAEDIDAEDDAAEEDFADAETEETKEEAGDTADADEELEDADADAE